jgi:hypothetical protein
MTVTSVSPGTVSITTERGVTQTATLSLAHEKLAFAIDRGRREGASTLERVKRDIPQDSIVRAGAMSFVPRPDAPKGDYRVALQFGENGSQRTIGKHAFAQLAGRAGVPSEYLTDLATSTTPWERDLAIRIMNDHLHEGHGADRLLVRSVHEQVRGVLSDKYRRLDSLPLLSAFAQECQALGAVPTGGTASEVRVALKAILPTIYEPIPGEALAIGVEWFNSDFGAGKYGIRSYILRLVCLNGATAEDTFSQVHLGGRLSEDVDYSTKTLRLDTEATESATRDHVRALLNPVRVDQSLAMLKAANEKHINWTSAKTKLAKSLLKGELQKVQDAFEGADVINLPPGSTEYRLSNAISWIANTAEDADRKLELERLAGSFFALPKAA